MALHRPSKNGGAFSLRALMVRATLILFLTASHANAEVKPLAYYPANKRTPAKVELRVDHFLVVRISCDGPRRLSFDFPIDGSYRSLPLNERQKPLEFSFDKGGVYPLVTRDTSKRRVGTLQLGLGFLKELDHSQMAWFWGPSDMGEPWTVTNLDALRRLVRGC